MARRERALAMGRAATLALIAVLVLGEGVALGEGPTGCTPPGTRLLAEAPGDEAGVAGSLVFIDPVDDSMGRLPVDQPRSATPFPRPGLVIVSDASGQNHLVRLEDGRSVPISGSVATAVDTVRSLTSWFRSPRWTTQRIHDAGGLRVRIIDRTRDRVVVETVFPRRIEIATTATSSDGRSVVHLQANNVASELTLFDAETATRRELRIPHGAPLAAYAISLTFSPDGACLAVSMAREGQLPESWLIDSRQPRLTARPTGDVFVLAWVAV